LYCPASLSPEDAEKLYASKIERRGNTLLECDNYFGKAWCDPLFISAYVEKSCMGNSKQDSLICAFWMNKSSYEEWKKYEDGICSNFNKIELCKKYADSTEYELELFNLMKKLETKKLLVINRMAEVEKEVEEKVPYKECVKVWDDYYPTQKMIIQSKSAYAGTFEFIFGYCSFNGGKNDKKNCLQRLEAAGKEWKKECKAGQTRTVKKTVKETRTESPFGHRMNQLYQHLMSYSWDNLDDLWLEKIRFLQKYDDIVDKEESIVNRLKGMYASSGDLQISDLLRYCKIYPKVDKSLANAFGFELFSCEDILKNKNPMVSCNDDTESTKAFPLTLSGNESHVLLCDFNHWRYKRDVEDYLGLCRKRTMGSESQDIYVCDTVWKAKTIYELQNKKCDDGVEVVGEKSGKTYKCLKGDWIIESEGSFVDMRDGQIYKMITIGEQTWMAQNLNFVINEGNSKSFCYDDDVGYCAKYGRLYDWQSAINACPSGWHLPSKDEWMALITNVGGLDKGGVVLKSKNDWKNDGNGIDTYGFSALPAGARSNDGDFYDAGDYAYFWSSSQYESSSNYAYSMYLNCNSELALLLDYSKYYGKSIRCLKNSN